MTEEEIKKIAAEIADTLYNEDRTYNHHLWWSVEPKERKTEEIEDIINIILRDHCIVPKVEILNQHAWYMQRMKEVSSNRQMNRGKAIALETLFGKEMFEEDKK